MPSPQQPYSDWRIVHELTEEIFAYLKRQRVTRDRATRLLSDLNESLGYHWVERLPESYD